jgi:hypothetical protein
MGRSYGIAARAKSAVGSTVDVSNFDGGEGRWGMVGNFDGMMGIERIVVGIVGSWVAIGGCSSFTFGSVGMFGNEEFVRIRWVCTFGNWWNSENVILGCIRNGCRECDTGRSDGIIGDAKSAVETFGVSKR